MATGASREVRLVPDGDHRTPFRATPPTQVRKLLADNRLVTLTGAGGVGKTRPPWASIASRGTSSCSAKAARITSGSASPPSGRAFDVGEQERDDPGG